MMIKRVKCPECGGSGMGSIDVCHVCNGGGTVNQLDRGNQRKPRKPFGKPPKQRGG